MHSRTTRCEHRSNHQMQWTPSVPSATRPPAPSTRCPRTPQGRGCAPRAGRCPPQGWQQGRDQPTARGTVNIVWRRAILVGGEAGKWDRSGCAQGAPRSANGQGEEQHSHTECGSHTKRDGGECSRQGGGGQRGRGGNQDSGNREPARRRWESMRMGGSDNTADGLANPGAPAAQRLSPSTLRGTCTQWATTGAHDASHAATSARRGSGTQGINPSPAAQRRCSSAPRGSHTWGSRTRKHREVGCGRPEDGGVWAAKTVKRPPQQPTQPQYANYWAPLTRKRHTMPHPAQPQHANQPQHTNRWAPRTWKQHQQEHWPQRPTESSDPTQHAKGRTGDCPGPRKETITRQNVTQGGDLQLL